MKYINKTSGSIRLVALLSGAALLGLMSQGALAAPVGTAAGTIINNKATLTYAIGAVTQPVIESKPGGNTVGGVGAGAVTTVLVDKKVNLTVVDPTAGTPHATTPGQLGSTGLNSVAYTVTNLGNSTQDFLLTIAQPVGGVLYGVTDTYDSTNCVAFVDANGNKIFDAGEKTYVDELVSGGTATVTVSCDTPTTVAVPAVINGAGSTVAVIAQAAVGGAPGVQGVALVDAAGAVDTAGVDVVFADAQGSDDAAGHDGKHSARDIYLVGSATLTVTKTATLLCDPISLAVTPHNIPGATVRYVVTISNAAGGVSAILSSIGDVIDANSTIEPNLVTVGSSCVTAESAAGSGFKIAVTGSSRATPTAYFTTVADGDAVGIAVDNVTITAAINTALPVEAGPGYAAGELKAGEVLTLTYNVTVK